MTQGYRLNWRGAQIVSTVIAAVEGGVTEFGLVHETEAKRELYPGHGKLTGTLQRSIHSAGAGYDWGGDSVSNGPERGGSGRASVQGSRISTVVGTGMKYGRRIEDLYGYMQRSHERVLPRLPDILNKHATRRGLT